MGVEDDELTDTLETISRFVDGRDDYAWEWDDFLTVPARSEEVKKIQGFCRELPSRFPPIRPVDYCSEPGLAELKEMLSVYCESRCRTQSIKPA